MNYQLSYRYGLVFRDAIHTTVDVCLLMAEKTKNPLLNAFLEVANEMYPQAVHECPYRVIQTIDCWSKTFIIYLSFSQIGYNSYERHSEFANSFGRFCLWRI